jgi:hypothetical protein
MHYTVYTTVTLCIIQYTLRLHYALFIQKLIYNLCFIYELKCIIHIAGFHEVKAAVAYRTHNPEVGICNSRSKPSTILYAANISFAIN